MRGGGSVVEGEQLPLQSVPDGRDVREEGGGAKRSCAVREEGEGIQLAGGGSRGVEGDASAMSQETRRAPHRRVSAQRGSTGGTAEGNMQPIEAAHTAVTADCQRRQEEKRQRILVLERAHEQRTTFRLHGTLLLHGLRTAGHAPPISLPP